MCFLLLDSSHPCLETFSSRRFLPQPQSSADMKINISTVVYSFPILVTLLLQGLSSCLWKTVMCTGKMCRKKMGLQCMTFSWCTLLSVIMTILMIEESPEWKWNFNLGSLCHHLASSMGCLCFSSWQKTMLSRHHLKMRSKSCFWLSCILKHTAGAVLETTTCSLSCV